MRNAEARGTSDPPGPVFAPKLIFPDDTVANDSTFLIKDLEQRYAGRSVFPQNQALAFLVSLFEDYCDEWVTKAMFHYRWTYDIDDAGFGLGTSAGYSAGFTKVQEWGKSFGKRQVTRLGIVGSNPITAPVIEQAFERLCSLLGEHFEAGFDFLFGTRPSAADFALYGQLHPMCSLDPETSRRVLAASRTTWFWYQSMKDLSGHSIDDESEGWFDPAALPPTLLRLLHETGRLYAPFMLANARAVAAGEKQLDCMIDGGRVHWVQPSFKYQAKCLGWLRKDYGELGGEEKELVDSVLHDCGSAAMFDHGDSVPQEHVATSGSNQVMLVGGVHGGGGDGGSSSGGDIPEVMSPLAAPPLAPAPLAAAAAAAAGVQRFEFTSGDGARICGLKALPGTRPLAVVQIVHGFGEHIGRYFGLAHPAHPPLSEALTRQGFAVYGHDHRGHGRTSLANGDGGGFFAEEGGCAAVVADCLSVTRQIKEELPGVPVVMLGHSMGSGIARSFVAAHGAELTALVLSGASGTPKDRKLSTLVQLVAEHGSRYRPPLPAGESALAMYDRPFEEDGQAGGGTKWLSRKHSICAEYDQDPLCSGGWEGGPTAGMLLELARASAALDHDGGLTAARSIPTSLPVLILSGEKDPVLGMALDTEGAYQLQKVLVEAGVATVSHTVYAGARHEVLNETNAEDVYADLSNFVRRYCLHKAATTAITARARL
jgi:alpha-beta hydrolase superfamily lysophospholipase